MGLDLLVLLELTVPLLIALQMSSDANSGMSLEFECYSLLNSQTYSTNHFLCLIINIIKKQISSHVNL